jgi:hypothetical protein
LFGEQAGQVIERLENGEFRGIASELTPALPACPMDNFYIQILTT